jgi:GDP-L-fucose synthase
VVAASPDPRIALAFPAWVAWRRVHSGNPSQSFWNGKRVVVTGGAGFLGGAVVPRLEQLGAEVRIVRSRDHDLRDPEATRDAVEEAEIVIHLAARVGGIGFNRRNPAPLAYDNLMMTGNIFEQCRLVGVEKLVSACTVCAYPKVTPTPFSEDDLWNGYPEESNAPYGLAKKMMLVLSDAYRRQYGFDSCVPIVANLYGPNDNFDLEDSHVIAAMIRKFVEAVERDEREVVLWGTGSPSREFLYVDDAARALLLAAERLDVSEPVNVGTGRETRIRDLAEIIQRLAGFEGEVVWDTTRPDGQPTRYLDVSRARELIGFEAEVPLEEGLRRTVESFRQTGPQPRPAERVV